MNFQLLLSITLIDVTFLLDLFKYKNINQGIIFHCSRNKMNDVQKIFNKHGILISTGYINKNKIEAKQNLSRKTGIIVDSSCRRWTSVFNTIAFEGTTSWVILTKNLSSTTGALVNFGLEVDSDVTIACKIGNTFTLYEMYNTGSRYNGTFVVRNIGYWNSTLSMVTKDRRDLLGAVIKISLVVLRTDKLQGQTVEQYMERGIAEADTINRMKFHSLLKYMRDLFNLSYDIQRVESWGYARNGSFDGLVGSLNKGATEIGGSPVFARADRAQYVQYVAEVWNSRHCFIFRHPTYPGGFYTIYKRPLSNTVWYCTMSLLVVTSLVLWLTLMMKGTDDSSLSLAAVTIWGAFCQQGSSINSNASTVKLVLFMTFFCCLTVYQYYNAMIVSSLLLEAPKSIKTLEDLLNSDLKVGVDDALYNRDYFRNTKDPIAIKLFKKKIQTATRENFMPPKEGMALVKKGGFAYHVDTTIAYPIIKKTFNEREVCETTTVQLYPLQKTAVVMRRFSPYKEHVTYGIRRMYEAGLLMRVQAVTDTPLSECVHTPDVAVFRVNISEFSTPLIVLTVGTIIAVIVLLGEVIVYKLRRRNVQFRN